MMNATLEPREVEKPFAQRWLRATLALLLRSPIRFGLLIALLGWVDISAVNFAAGHVVEKIWVDRLGIVTLPFIWVLVSAVARGADDNRQTWHALAQLRRRPVWVASLVAGTSLAVLNWIIYSLLHGLHAALGLHESKPYLLHQGQFLDSVEASVLLLSITVGLCYFPLLVLAPELSSRHARHLADKAGNINGRHGIMLLIAIVVLGAIALAATVPAYGMTTAAYLVFIGVLNYVAYRDIFDRRIENLPRQVATSPVAATVRAAR